MRKLFIATVLGASFIAPAIASDLNYNIVEFNETASVTVPTDTMNITLKISETGKNRNEINNNVTKKLNKIIQSARKSADLEISLSNRYTQPDYDNNGKIRAWTDNAIIQVNSTNFNLLTQWVAEHQETAILENVRFSVSPEKHAKAVEEASDKAMKSFKQRANHISQNLGFSGYKIVKLQLNQSYQNRNSSDFAPMVAMASMKMARSADNESMEIESKDQEISQSVNVQIQMY